MAVKLRMKTFRTAREVIEFANDVANNVAEIIDVEQEDGTYTLWFIIT